MNTPTSATFATLPGPRRLPWLGNALQIEVSRLHQQLETWAQTYGSRYRCDLGPRPGIVISEPEIARLVLQSRPTPFRRVSRFAEMFAELGIPGVFSAEGEAWRQERKLVNRALEPGHLGTYFPTLEEVVRQLHGRWARAAQAGAVVDLRDDFIRFTVDVVTSLVFAMPVDSLNDRASELVNDVGEVFPLLARRLNAALPYWRVFKPHEDRQAEDGLARVRAWMLDTIAEVRARMAADPARTERPRDLLEGLLGARDADGNPYADDVVIGNGVQMLGAGEDTTANTLAWAVHLLLDAPHEIDHLRAEADEVLGAAPWPEDLDTANRLSRVDAVANEAMRLKSVAPVLFLEATENVQIDDLELPKGTTVILCTRLIGMDPTWMDEPLAFRPDRFADPATVKDAQRRGVFLPFGLGPRMCPGRGLAMLEIRLALATLFRNFEVIREGASDAVQEVFGFTMHPSQLSVRLRARASDPRPRSSAPHTM